MSVFWQFKLKYFSNLIQSNYSPMLLISLHEELHSVTNSHERKHPKALFIITRDFYQANLKCATKMLAMFLPAA